MMSLIMGLMLSLWGMAVLLTIVGTIYTLFKLSGNSSQTDSKEIKKDLVPISILKPLKGIESGVLENLETFFHLDYPAFEIIFSVADLTDPILSEVKKLIFKYPYIDAKLVVGDTKVGMNPKVNNMIRSFDLAKHDWVWISDSNTRVAPDYLKRLVPQFGNEIGVLTAVVAGKKPEGWGGCLESVYLNTFYARWTELAYAFGQAFVIGKSMCFRKSMAERFGGLRTLAQYIAEDNMLGESMKKLGLRVVVMKDPVSQHIGSYDFATFWSRHIRWGRIRKSQVPVIFFLEPLVNALLPGLMGAIASNFFWRIPVEVFLMSHLGFWFLCDLLLMRRLNENLNPMSILAWWFREVLSIPHWIHMACGSTVSWRGQKLKLRKGGVVSPMDIKVNTDE